MSDAAHKNLKVSREGIVLIKSFEGFRPRAIQRIEGGWVIGYGHTLSAREGATVSEADAELLLRYDLLPVEKSVNAEVPGELNQHQFDALVSFAFSVGLERFVASDVLQRLSAGAPNEAADAIMGWPEAALPQLALRRRAAERALFVANPGMPVALADLLSAPLPATDPLAAVATVETQADSAELPVASESIEAESLVAEPAESEPAVESPASDEVTDEQPVTEAEVAEASSSEVAADLHVDAIQDMPPQTLEPVIEADVTEEGSVEAEAAAPSDEPQIAFDSRSAAVAALLGERAERIIHPETIIPTFGGAPVVEPLAEPVDEPVGEVAQAITAEPTIDATEAPVTTAFENDPSQVADEVEPTPEIEDATASGSVADEPALVPVNPTSEVVEQDDSVTVIADADPTSDVGEQTSDTVNDDGASTTSDLSIEAPVEAAHETPVIVAFPPVSAASVPLPARYSPYGTPMIGPLPYPSEPAREATVAELPAGDHDAADTVVPFAPLAQAAVDPVVEAEIEPLIYRPSSALPPAEAFAAPTAAELVLTPFDNGPEPALSRPAWTVDEREGHDGSESNLFGEDLSLTQGGSILRNDIEVEAPARFDWRETGPFIFMGGVGLVSFGASMAAFRRAAESSGGGDLTIIGWVLALIGLGCVGVSSVNLYRRFGLPGAD